MIEVAQLNLNDLERCKCKKLKSVLLNDWDAAKPIAILFRLCGWSMVWQALASPTCML